MTAPRRLFTALAASLVLSAPATAQDSQRYATLILGSVHFGIDLNDFNPGLLLGHRWSREGSAVEYHLEGGVFYNSYEEVSPIIMAGVSYPVATLGRVDLRGGVSVGTAYYGELAPTLDALYDIPSAGGFIPLVAANLALRDTRHENVEYRFTALPGDGGVGVLNLSIAFDF